MKMLRFLKLRKLIPLSLSYFIAYNNYKDNYSMVVTYFLDMERLERIRKELTF